MIRSLTCHVAALVVVSASASIATAAPAKKKAGPTKAPAKRVLLGTKQLSGDQAVLGQEFTLGKVYPMNFQLDSAEYSVARLRIGSSDFTPKADEKFLVLHFTLHNPQQREATIRSDTFHFTAVDDTDANREGGRPWGITSTKGDLGQRLKPGQKLAAYTYVVVPASATVPKLIVKANDNTVLRYDLRGKVKPLTGPALDPAKPDGAGALSNVPAAFGTAYEMGDWDVTIDSAAYSTAKLPGPALRRDERYLVLTGSVRNAIQRGIPLRHDTIQAQVTDADGVETRLRIGVLRASSDEPAGGTVSPDNTLRVRLYAPVPAGVALKSLRLAAGAPQRAYVFDASAIQ